MSDLYFEHIQISSFQNFCADILYAWHILPVWESSGILVSKPSTVHRSDTSEVSDTNVFKLNDRRQLIVKRLTGQGCGVGFFFPDVLYLMHITIASYLPAGKFYF